MEIQNEHQTVPPGYNKVNFFIIVKGGASEFIEFMENVFLGKENKFARTPDRDGSLIHAEVRVGDSTILVTDSKSNWLFTPAFPQVYVDSAQETLDRAVNLGAEKITEVSDFYNGLKIARFRDPWGNIWWLFEKISDSPKPTSQPDSDISWHEKKPGKIYTTLMDAMQNLKSHSI